MKKAFFTILTLLLVFASCGEKNQNSNDDITESSPETTLDSLALALGMDPELLIDERQIPMDGPVNFRDLGGIETQDGKSVKWGKLFRSDKLSELSAADIDKIKEKGIKVIVDFRTKTEVEEEPDTLPADYEIDYVHLPIGDDSWSKGDFMQKIRKLEADSMEWFMMNLYKDMPLKYSEQYKAYFDTISSSEKPLVFHCTAGKDRTGIASALLLYSLGVDTATINHEYELSNYYRYHSNKEYEMMLEQYGISAELSRIMMGVKGRYMNHIFSAIEAKYGSMDTYLEDALGVDSSKKAILRAQYLE